MEVNKNKITRTGSKQFMESWEWCQHTEKPNMCLWYYNRT